MSCKDGRKRPLTVSNSWCTPNLVMRQSQILRRKGWLAFSAAAACLAALVLVLSEADTMRIWLNVSLAFMSMLACIIFLVWGGVSIYEANQFAKMESGEEVIARW